MHSLFDAPEQNGKKPSKGRGRVFTISLPTIVVLILFNLVILGAFGWEYWQSLNAGVAQSETPAVVNSSTPTLLATREDESTPLANTPVPPAHDGEQFTGLIVLAMSDSGYTHLFAYQPETLPFTRLTSGEWDDIHPALSPNGANVAFASHRGGQWDIYVLDLSTGDVTRVTNDLDYDGSPSWSSDGLWLAYEKYVGLGNNLEIYIAPIDASVDPIRVTVDPAADFAPAWRPNSNELAFTSDRAGEFDIWLANLDRTGDERFSNLTRNPTASQTGAQWSPDGTRLAWLSPYAGYSSIYIYDMQSEDAAPRYLASGNDFTWDGTGEQILAVFSVQDRHMLSAYSTETGTFTLPPHALRGQTMGVTWARNSLPSPMPNALADIAAATVQAPWAAALTPDAGALFGRQLTIDLADVDAPHAALNALVVQPFYALRDRIVAETDWDPLSSLENAFVPVTEPLAPGRRNDWLYTGRAFSLNPTLIEAGWMAVVREDVGAQTYWRVYLKTRFQDGQQGQPLTAAPWDFDARFSGSTTDYENGGRLLSTIPAGYWIDFTALAEQYGWERLPALSNWQSYIPGAVFSVFVITSGLEWEQAMLQLYPPEVLVTPTPFPP